MLQRPQWTGALAALCLLLSTPALAGDHLAVLTGNDFGLYSVDTADGSVQHHDTYPGFPGSAALADGIYAAVVSGDDRIHLYGALTLNPLGTVTCDAGSNPYDVAYDPAYGLFATLWISGELVRYDLSGTETGRASVGLHPQGVAVSGGNVYVANTGFRFSDYGYDPGTVMVFDAATLAPLDTVAVGVNPQDLGISAGKVHVLCTGDYAGTSGTMHILDAGSHAPVDTLALGGSPGFLAVADDAVFTADYFGGIFGYDPVDHQVWYDAASPLLSLGSGYTACAPDGMGHLYITQYDNDAVAKIDLGTGATVDTYLVGDGPQHVLVVPDAPTPVRVLTFTAERSGPDVALAWRAQADRNALDLVLERRRGNSWITLASVPWNGAYRDADHAGDAEYRLTVVDRDGSRRELGRASVAGTLPLAVRVLENPVRGALTAVATGLDGGARLELFSVTGRRVSARRVSGNTPVTLEAPAAGQYFLRLVHRSTTVTTRVTVLP